MKIRINKYNKEDYINTLTDSLNRFITYCNQYPDNKKYTYCQSIAESLLTNYNEIALNILQFCFDVQYVGKEIFPAKMLNCMHAFKEYVFNKDKELLTLEQQQEMARNYIHFDFSVKKPKTLMDI